MMRRPPRSTRTDTLFPYTSLFRSPYFDAQAGVRQDFGPGPSPTQAVLGFEGLAPYWFEVEGALFLLDKGDVTARIEGSYDQRITQRLILQPIAEAEVAFQDVPARSIGHGPSSIEPIGRDHV